jgi:hypothetical protein
MESAGGLSSREQEHLRLLSTFHYVVAALAALFALLPVFHLFLGFVMMTAGIASGERGALPAAIAGAFFVAFASLWMLLGFAFAGCVLAAGRFLAERRHYVFCLVVAGFCCAFSPFGTVLGIFTLLVLLRDDVREAFGRPVRAPAPPSAPTPAD